MEDKYPLSNKYTLTRNETEKKKKRKAKKRIKNKEEQKDKGKILYKKIEAILNDNAQMRVRIAELEKENYNLKQELKATERYIVILETTNNKLYIILYRPKEKKYDEMMAKLNNFIENHLQSDEEDEDISDDEDDIDISENEIMDKNRKENDNDGNIDEDKEKLKVTDDNDDNSIKTNTDTLDMSISEDGELNVINMNDNAININDNANLTTNSSYPEWVSTLPSLS